MRLRRSFAFALLAGFALGPALLASTPETVDVKAPDGVVLKATYWPAAKPGPGVLLLHMCNTTRVSWAGLGPKLAALGVHALAVDYRGFGESGGERSPDIAVRRRVALETWPGDVDAAFAALRARSGEGVSIFGAAGGSCGVNQALMLARRNPQIRALALLAGVSDRDGERFLAENPWLPVLGVASRDDGNAVSTLRWLVGFSGHAGNEFREYAEGGHGTELFKKHAELEPAVADWFHRHLVRSPVVATPPSATGARGPSALLSEALLKPGAAADVRARLAAAKARGEAASPPPEDVVNRIGYQLIETHPAAALELFALNTELQPDSANAWDSLADGYKAAGKAELAVEAARRSLALLPADPASDTAAQKAIRNSLKEKLPAP